MSTPSCVPCVSEYTGYSAGFAREIITPPPGAPLAGYFAPRPSCGVLDELEAKAALLQSGAGPLAGVIALDLLYASDELVPRIRHALRQRGFPAPAAPVICATHTHTGPYAGGVFDEDCVSPEYLDAVADKAASAAMRAWNGLRPAELLCASATDNPFAFNRRFFMKDGRVVTNPGKRNPDIVRPEGAVDRQIHVLAVRSDGALAGVLVNIANHADTTGGNRISRDWPGHLEARLQELLGRPVPVLVLIAPSGNINHFDVSSAAPQTSPAEAQRIGRGYAEIVRGMLDGLIPLEAGDVRSDNALVQVAFRSVTPEELAGARRVLAEPDAGRTPNAVMTAEDLAAGCRAAERFFAGQLLEFARAEQGRVHEYAVTAIRIGRRVTLVGLPGEPFTEIGMRIKDASPFPTTLVVAHANGACGYVPLPECFARGGYETLPRIGGGAGQDTADRLVSAARRVLSAQC